MAFATTDVVRENAGSLAVVRGTWTATEGDAAGTITIGGYATEAEFYDNKSSGPYQRIPANMSFSNGQTTVTVYHQGTVTAGRFRVLFK